MAPVVPIKSAPSANSSKPQAITPNQTLYVTNIPSSKITKPDLRTALYLLFSTYGTVLDVVALKTMKMRGQAHIVYRDIHTATQAMRVLQGFEFFGLELNIQYAKSKSHFVSKLDGTFKLPGSNQGAVEVTVTELQASIFNALAPAPGAKVSDSKLAVADIAMRDSTSAAVGQKRTRDEESDMSDSDVAMEEDSDDD